MDHARQLLVISMKDTYVVMSRESLLMQNDTYCLFHCIVLCGVWNPRQQKKRRRRKEGSRSTASTSSLVTVSHWTERCLILETLGKRMAAGLNYHRH